MVALQQLSSTKESRATQSTPTLPEYVGTWYPGTSPQEEWGRLRSATCENELHIRYGSGEAS